MKQFLRDAIESMVILGIFRFIVSKFKGDKKMEKDIIEGNLSPSIKYDVEFKGGALVAMVDYVGPYAGAGVKVSLPAEVILSALQKAIPGKIDDAFIELLKASLKS
jgi:hypothetical protein